MALISQHDIDNVSEDTFLPLLEKICFNNDLLSAHEEWERADQEWGDTKKMKNVSDAYMLKMTARVRNAFNYKSTLFDEAAYIAYLLSDNLGLCEEYEGNTLGDATIVDDVEEGSLDWLNLRRQGVGGSSLMDTLGFHWKSRPGDPVFMTREQVRDHWEHMALEKCTPIVEKVGKTGGVLFRGHMWEPALIAWYALTNKVRVGVSKATWHGKHPLQVVNVDGLVLDNKGRPMGLLECKTSSREWTWKWGVPMHYRAQVLWYLESFGLDWCDVIVKFDTGFIETYRINRGETIDGTKRTKTVPEYYDWLMDMWNRYVQPAKDNPDSVWDADNILDDKFREMDAVIPEVNINPNFWSILSDSNIVRVSLCAPYDRMDDHFTIATGFETELSDGFIAYEDVSPVYYPVSEEYIFSTPASRDDVPIEDFVRSEIVLALDDDTYHYLTDTKDWAQVINLSDVRRLVEMKPNWGSFHTIGDARAWISSHV